VHANSSKAGVLARLAAWLARVPVRIFTVHGWAFAQHAGAASRVYLALDRFVRPLTSVFICVSAGTRDEGVVARTCVPDRTLVIPNAVDVDVPRSPLGGDPPRIISVGRLKAPKDFATFLAALGRIAVPYRAAIIGDGPDRAALAELASAADVELLGERDDVRHQLAASDVFVLPSRSEGMPMSILEAMAAGLPVVATRVGGVPELVAEGTGLLVPPGDVDALHAALDLVLRDAELRGRLGRAARARVETHYALDAFRAAHIEVYERELSRVRGRRSA
jgi:glycosyltransferase involved in cell wall biosynthesis